MRVLPINDAVEWAYRDELPKRETAGSLGATASAGLADYGTSVDHWDREPGYPVALGAPHPDAIVIDNAVQTLKPFAIDAAASAPELAPECASALGEADLAVLSNLTVDARMLVIRHASMGTAPDWTIGKFSLSRLYARNGRIRVIDADDNGRYGACPLEILPNPRAVLIDRAEYFTWWSALALLAAALATGLGSISVRPTIASPRPWLGPPAPLPKIHKDLSQSWLSSTKPRRSKGTWA